MSPNLKSAVIQGVRAFIGAFIGIYPLTNLVGSLGGSQPLDVAALRSAAAAGLVALVMFLWRLFVDPLPVPTLVDHNPAPVPIPPAA